MDEDKFVYPKRVNFDETVTMGDGSVQKRYGRRRQRAFQHLGDQAPLEEDGSLFDRANAAVIIMPINVKRETGPLQFTSAGRVLGAPSRVIIHSYLPGVGAFGD